MRPFHVTIRVGGTCTHYIAIAHSSADAFDQAAVQFEDVPCGITVIAEVR